MAGLNHEQLQQDMARALGRGMIRSGVKVMLDSNALGGEQLSPCPACHGEATTAESLPPTEKGMREPDAAPIDLHNDVEIGKHLYDLACAVRYPGVEARGWDALGDKGRDEYIQIAVDFRALMRTLYVGNAGDVEGNGFVISDDGKVVNYLGENYYVADDWNDARLAQLHVAEAEAKLDISEIDTQRASFVQKVEAAIEQYDALRGIEKDLHQRANAAESGWAEEARLRKRAERTLEEVADALGYSEVPVNEVRATVRNALAEAETRGRAKLVAEMNKLVTSEKEEEIPDVRFD